MIEAVALSFKGLGLQAFCFSAFLFLARPANTAGP
jgi:hypothetical protein